MKVALLSVIAVVFFGYPVIVFSKSSIKFAAVIYRHGARTPIDPYPLDPYKNESLWPEKFGQLVNEGKMEHFLLGEWLRKRYQHLVSERYDPDEVSILSTSVDRTIMSAQINTAGLYPPKGKEVWDDKLKWQPVPIRTVAVDDEILAMQKKCPAHDKEMKRYYSTSEYLQKLASYTDLMEYVSEHAGVNVKNFTKLEYIYSTLSIESFLGFKLPKWTEKVFPDAMREPSCFSFKLNTITPTLARLKAGPLLNEITQHMVKSVLHSNKTQKLIIYSGHDNTVANLLGALRLFDGHCPAFTATILIELLSDDSIESYSSPLVRVSYRNATGLVSPIVFSIPGCGGAKLCPMETFLKLYNNVTNVDFNKDCNAGTWQVRVDELGACLHFVILYTVIFTLLAITALLLCMFIQRSVVLLNKRLEYSSF